jgi:foldase protein PrsA
MARKNIKIKEKNKPKSFFHRFGKYSLLIPVIIVGIVFSWLYQTKNIVWTIGSETITKEEVLLEIKRIQPDYEEKLKKITDTNDRKDAEDALNSKAMENLLKLKCVYLYAKEKKIKATQKDIDAVIDSFKKSLEQSGNKTLNLKETLAEYGISYRSFMKDMRSQAIYNKVLEPVRNEVTVTDEELKAQYEKTPLSYDVPDTAHVLLISLGKETGAEAQAQEIAKKIEAGGDFLQIAREKSLAPDAATNGGDIGWQTKDNLLQEIGENVFHPDIVLNVPYPILARDGWYVFMVKEKKAAVKRTFQTAKELVRNDVLYLKRNQAIDGFMVRLTEKYEMMVKMGNPWENFLQWWDRQRGKIK